jgi:bacterioferritin
VADSTDLRHVVAGALTAERDAIATYQEIIAACDGTDPVTTDLAVNILADEEKHRSLFEGFLKSMDKAKAA